MSGNASDIPFTLTMKIDMYKLIMSLTLILGFTGIQASSPVQVKTKTDQVTIYRQAALVSRVAEVSVEQGRQEIRFLGLSEYLDPATIQIFASSEMTLMSISHKVEPLSASGKSEYIIDLEEKRNRIQDSLDQFEMKLSVLKDEEALLIQNRDLGDNVNDRLAQIKALSAYYNQRLSEIRQDMLSLNNEMKPVKDRLKKVQSLIDDYYRSIQGKRTASILIEVKVPEKMTVPMEVRYVVNNATWSTSYDVHVKDISSPLNLVSKGAIVNNTREEWKDATIVLSTGNPRRSTRIPELSPWWLRYGPVIAYGRQEKDMMSNVRMEVEEMAVADGVRPGAPNTETRENMTTTEYTLDGRMTIPADGKEHEVVLIENQLQARYEYTAVPKRDLRAYLAAHISDWEKLNLHRGRANLFLDNAFVGRTFLDPGVLSDTMTLSLGADIGISIERENTRDYRDEALLGKKVTRELEYRISVKNYKSSAIDITIKDQVPLSTDEDISVENINRGGAVLDKEKGILTWALKLSPGEERSLNFGYSVKYDKNKPINLP